MVPAFNLPFAISMKAAMNKGKAKPFNEADVSHDDVAFLQYTGGTTGVAKGAALTHKNMIANVLHECGRTWHAFCCCHGGGFACNATCFPAILIYLGLGPYLGQVCSPKVMDTPEHKQV